MDTPFVHIYIDLPHFQTIVICQEERNLLTTEYAEKRGREG